MAIDQIAQFGLSSLQVIYYFAKLFSASLYLSFKIRLSYTRCPLSLRISLWACCARHKAVIHTG
ncbi:hypothetical protein DF214_00990 [Pectobacterium atrosepticum]|nr:hypothetical protein CVS35_11570 [Pectobacterium atrosepticum]PWD67437.1 hypothetical protein DF214_00990 [Pectobacterium atrosepticum]QXE13507.1 hypothetical protein DCX48_02660 [Pectobacterium atrosepticum]